MKADRKIRTFFDTSSPSLSRVEKKGGTSWAYFCLTNFLWYYGKNLFVHQYWGFKAGLSNFFLSLVRRIYFPYKCIIFSCNVHRPWLLSCWCLIFFLSIFNHSIFTFMYINNTIVGREAPQHFIVSVLGSCCLKKISTSLGSIFLSVCTMHMAPCGGWVLTQWLVYKSTTAANVSSHRDPQFPLSRSLLSSLFLYMNAVTHPLPVLGCSTLCTTLEISAFTIYTM